MTIKELKQILDTMDENMRVVVWAGTDFEDADQLTISDFEFNDNEKKRSYKGRHVEFTDYDKDWAEICEETAERIKNSVKALKIGWNEPS